MSNIAVKLSTLFIRQISKPVANVIKAEAKNHAGFKRFCVAVAQNLHFFDNSLKMRLLKHPPRPIRPLNEARAIENGANFLSESFIFLVASGAVLFETSRQRQKEKGRREAVADDIATLQDEIEQMKKQLEQQSITIQDYKVPEDYKPLFLQMNKSRNVISSKGHEKPVTEELQLSNGQPDDEGQSDEQ
ncbi:DEKNAAC100761 [Brettanomyces naardenensis]|uniref:DEKNAAC100761 n=1 Tax=Brettanomyces naardenensis TaxID=13370 RepID=A0A448YGF4_BRENA|nr:DEKNAAC100761 [Brettanomyces naardenensis]